MARTGIPPFELFYESHRGEVLAFLRRRAGRERADDLFQETFLRALRAYGRLEHGEHLRAWVLTIATNTVDRHGAAGAAHGRARGRAGGRGRASRRRGARAADRRPAAEGARGGRAPLRLRPRLRRRSAPPSARTSRRRARRPPPECGGCGRRRSSDDRSPHRSRRALPRGRGRRRA